MNTHNNPMEIQELASFVHDRHWIYRISLKGGRDGPDLRFAWL